MMIWTNSQTQHRSKELIGQIENLVTRSLTSTQRWSLNLHICTYLYIVCLCIVQCSAVQDRISSLSWGGGKSTREVDDHDGNSYTQAERMMTQSAINEFTNTQTD